MEVEKTVYHHRGEQESGWSFWETYRDLEKGNKNQQNQNKGEKQYESTLNEIFSFNNLNDLSKFWYNCSYEDSSNLLFSTLDDTEKRVERYNRLFVIDSLNLFREGIKPVWEDPLNQNGYDLRLELDVYSDNREQTEITYKLLWQNQVFSLIGEECDYSNQITGIRFKVQPSKSVLRLEIWIRSTIPSTEQFNNFDNSVALDTIEDGNLKTCIGIRRWVEDTVKEVRKIPDGPFRLEPHKH